MTKMDNKTLEIKLVGDKTEEVNKPEKEITNDDIFDALDRLEEANNNLVKSSRLRGFTEGCLVTLGGVTLVSLILAKLNSR